MRSLHDPWELGGLTIPNRVMLAPLAGIGNWFVRLQAKRYGAGLAVSEMISSFAIHYGNRKTLDELLAVHPDEGPWRSSSSARTPRSCAAPPRRSRGRRRPDRPEHGLPGPEGHEDRRRRGADQRPGHCGRGGARRARGFTASRSPSSCAPAQKPGGVEGVEVAKRLVHEAGVAGLTFHPRSAAVRHKGTPDYDLAAELVQLPVPVIVSRRDGGRRAHPLGVRAHRLRGGDAGARRARQPVAVRARSWARATGEPTREEILAEWSGSSTAPRSTWAERAARYLRKFHPWYVERLGEPKARSGRAAAGGDACDEQRASLLRILRAL